MAFVTDSMQNGGHCLLTPLHIQALRGSPAPASAPRASSKSGTKRSCCSASHELRCSCDLDRREVLRHPCTHARALRG